MPQATSAQGELVAKHLTQKNPSEDSSTRRVPIGSESEAEADVSPPVASQAATELECEIDPEHAAARSDRDNFYTFEDIQVKQDTADRQEKMANLRTEVTRQLEKSTDDTSQPTDADKRTGKRTRAGSKKKNWSGRDKSRNDQRTNAVLELDKQTQAFPSTTVGRGRYKKTTSSFLPERPTSASSAAAWHCCSRCTRRCTMRGTDRSIGLSCNHGTIIRSD